MIPGLKVDKGYDKVGLPNTAKGPLGHPETWCKGIDDLEQRAADAYKQGARFAKWRNVLQIDPATGLPSDLSILEATHQLSRYATFCKSILPLACHQIYQSWRPLISYRDTQRFANRSCHWLAIRSINLGGHSSAIA